MREAPPPPPPPSFLPSIVSVSICASPGSANTSCFPPGSSRGVTMGGPQGWAVPLALLALSLLCVGVASLPPPRPRVFLSFEGRRSRPQSHARG